MIDKLKTVLKKHNIACDNITEDTELIAGLGLSSLQIMMMALDIEDAFDIEIPDRALKDLKTVGDVLKMIQELE